MTKQIHTIFEHQTLTQADFACVSDFLWLLNKVEAKHLPCFTLKVESGQVALLVRYYLAVIRLPSGCLLEILPKISQTDTATAIKSKSINSESIEPKSVKSNAIESNINETRQWLTNMLRAIYGIKQQPLPILASTESKLSTAHQPWETWLQPLLQQWFEVLHSLQLPKSYQQQQYNHPQAQGKLLIKQQLQHNHHRPHYRYTQQQQLQLNPLWGQFFNTALTQLTHLGTSIPIRVQQTVTALFHSQPIPSSSPVVNLPPSQWHRTYQQLQHSLSTNNNQQDKNHREQLNFALSVAWIILQMQDMATPTIGTQLLPAVMINMQQAFEKWVTLSIQRDYLQKNHKNHQSHHRLITQAQSVWLSEVTESINDDKTSALRYLQPDILITKEIKEVDETKTSPVIIVADIKYKTINKFSDISTHDLYQIYTYQQHWQAQQAWLIFPQSDYLQSPQTLQTISNATAMSTAMNDGSITNNSTTKTKQRTQKKAQSQIQDQIMLVPFDVTTGRLINSKLNSL